MKLELACSCGASLKVCGWLLQNVDVSDWTERHQECIRQAAPPKDLACRRCGVALGCDHEIGCGFRDISGGSTDVVADDCIETP